MSEQPQEGSVRPKPIRLIRLKEVRFRVGLSRSTIYRRMKEGTFPKAFSLGGPIVAWKEGEIDDWITRAIEPSK